MVHKEFMTKRQLKEYEAMEAKVIELNKQFPVDYYIQLRKDDGSCETDKIEYPFSIMSGSVVAWLEKNGSYLAERVEEIPF